MTILKNPSLKFILGLLFIFALMGALLYEGWAQTEKPKVCLLCHMMKPEYYTWQASSHEKVPCIKCHNLPGLTDEIKRFKKIYFAVTGKYTSPIKILKTIPNSNCIPCHNLKKRVVNASGDVIIPHEAHEKKKIQCIKCHKWVVHGNIANRMVTYESDYGKWNKLSGKTLMTVEHLRPEMEECMRCHKARKGPLDCKACHKTTMLPEDHKNKSFLQGNHGKLSAKDLSYCNGCHQYMSKVIPKGFQEKESYVEFLKSQVRNNNLKNIDPGTKAIQSFKQTSQPENLSQSQLSPNAMKTQSYAKENTFCKDCHAKRPASHDRADFINNHGDEANKDRQKCFMCHDTNPTGRGKLAKKACNQCHPSVHSTNVQWKKHHPVEFPPKPKVTQECYTCHVADACERCHMVIKTQNNSTEGG